MTDLPASHTASARLGLPRFLLLLLAALLALFPEIFAGTHTFYYRDYALFSYPVAWLHHQSFWQGEIPLWNPLSNCGLPHLAQWNTLVFYPPSLFYLLLPMPWALGFFELGHVLLGGAGMYLLLRRWTGSELAAALAGGSFALSGFALSSLMLPNYTATLAWMPWVVLCGQRAAIEGGRRLLGASAVAALQWLAAAPEFIIFTWVILAGLTAADATPLRSTWTDRLKPWGRLCLVGIIMLALTAAQTLPFIDLLRHSQRDVNYDPNVWALPRWGWANLLVPLFHTTPSLTGVYTQQDQQWTSSYYVGIIPLVLAFLAPAGPARRRAWTLLGLSVLGLWMALGVQGGLYAAVKAAFPSLGFIRYPAKYVVIAAFTLPALGGLGLQAVMANPKLWGRLVRVASLAAGLIMLLIAIAWRWPVPYEVPWTTMLNGLLRLAFLGSFLFLLWRWLRGGAPHLAWIVAAGLAGLAMADNLTHMPRQNPTVPVIAFQSADGLLRNQSHPGGSRAATHPYVNHVLGYAVTTNALQYCYGNRQALFCNWNLVDGIAKINGFYSLYPREHSQLITRAYATTNQIADSLLDFLAVTHTNSPADWFTMAPRTTAMPLVSMGQRPLFVAETAALARVTSTNFQPRTEVVLPARAAAQLPVEADPRASAQLIRAEPHRWTIRTTSEKPALLVIAQTYYHNWQATIDGQPATIWPANYAFQAVAVPSGQHEIRLVYVDRWFQWGAILSVISLAACLALALGWRRNPTGTP